VLSIALLSGLGTKAAPAFFCTSSLIAGIILELLTGPNGNSLVCLRFLDLLHRFSCFQLANAELLTPTDAAQRSVKEDFVVHD
jgi:hypothetical protein